MDNGSPGPSQEYLSSVPNSEYIRNNTNVGFPRAVNQGIEASTSDHILLLNDDAFPTRDDWLGKLQRHLKGNVGAVGPVTNFCMGHQQNYYDCMPQYYFAEYLIYFCVLFHRDVINSIGLLDEQFGLGGNEDLDYSIRMADAGWKMKVDRGVNIYHYGAYSNRNTMNSTLANENKTCQQLEDKWGTSRIRQMLETPLITTKRR